MPLKKGASSGTVSSNIEELEHAGKGRSHKQNIAIAMSEARKTGKGKALAKFKAKYGEGK